MDSLNILLVEDDPQIQRAWALGLAQAGYNVVPASTLSAAKTLLLERKFDAGIIDVNLEDGSGLELLQWLKTQRISIKTLLVTARLDEETALTALQRGATEFIRKPIGHVELTTRLDRMFRYTNETASSLVHYRDLTLNEDRKEIFFAGKSLKLSPSEYEIFRLLLRNAGHPVSRELLLEALDLSDRASDRTIDSHVSRIRKKMKDLGLESYAIESAWGNGYCLVFKNLSADPSENAG